ncbi:TetR/AcrR family transcriptional regulator C-terminal domain-containing protein [Actinocatenispora rupis]|uniref:TetR/AcrR family transcriptional regulator C-terminal domain-containing protein n=1 Tax=Actinocatenispora rupis TaxID=519421 RepID=UPI00194300D9|nr:TetR/AcrR family transcriptional regulator C-terminal domain-containing protein [Actinocatenispora rupis]
MPQQRRTDRGAIVAASIAVLDERGLDKLSLHAVAARLGVAQPALYHHFRDKSEILAAVAAEVLDRHHTERLPHPGDDWRDLLVRYAQSLRRAMLAVRDGARLLALAGPRAPQLANAVAQVSFLEAHGFTGADAILAYVAVSRYTIGATLEQQTARDGGAIRFPDGDAPSAESAHLLDLAAQVAKLGPDHEFAVGLTALVHGLAPLRHP